MLLLGYIILLTLTFTAEISATVHCYTCGDEEYDYQLTADNLPDALTGCSNFTATRNCYITLTWDNGISSIGTYHDILDAPESKEMAFISVLANDNQPSTTFRYLCATEFCNTPANLKRALRSATVEHSLVDLVSQLNSSIIFDPTSCYSFQNGSVCSPSTGCQHCHITMRPNWKNVTSIEICARCDSAGRPYFEAMTYFDLIERKRYDDFDIRCLTPNCNSLDNVELVRRKTNFQFDYDKYFGTNHGNILASSIFPIFTIIQTFYLFI
ncbi:unnamed protein product [Adineta ricciae]|uniref:Uncharacterized protein n=1 Tax=Adineta ricciae TaxID=249248 RepID=A0A814FNM5_ADIRI|nr:unnamed protein product [Adineta ricciae]CAF1280207.1 unnamed protein product [Adineta ricciae]